MKKIHLYLSSLLIKYLLMNTVIISIIIIFLNMLEISRILNDSNMNITSMLYLSILKLPTIISEITPFITIISVAFLYRNLISNNELISMRNIGFSIIDIFKPIGYTLLLFGILILLILNPMISIFEKEFKSITSQKNLDIYSIKFIDNGMWIKNITDKDEKIYINIKNINLKNMEASDIKILKIKDDFQQIILSKKGFIRDKIFYLNEVSRLDIKDNNYLNFDNYEFKLNFNRSNIIDSISNYKFIPFYKYKKHINNLKKFDLYSNEVSLFYLSELLKPIFLITIGFVVMGFSSKFKRNENFFKVLFISVLIGFLIFLFKEIMINITGKKNLNFIYSYLIILLMPMLLGLYQAIKIEKN